MKSEKILENDISRRDFLGWMSAITALLTTSGCMRQPEEKVIPYAREPELIVPGKPLFFATAFPSDGYGLGILAESHMGRPTKIEGNQSHPGSLGGSDVFGQASILGLYDPDRSQTVFRNERISTWDLFCTKAKEAMSSAGGTKGTGSFRILTGTITSPTLADQIERLTKGNDVVRWHQHQPISKDNAKQGAALVLGDATLNVYHDLLKADAIVSFDCDFLTALPGKLAYARQFAKRRKGDVNGKPSGMNRLYVAESSVSLAGGVAEHRLAVSPSVIAKIMTAVARGLGLSIPELGSLDQAQTAWVRGVVSDLKSRKGSSVVFVGESQPPALHALGHLINDSLGNIGSTVFYTEAVESKSTLQDADFKQLVADMMADKVDGLIIIGVNPVYTAPADLEFAKALQKVRFKARVGSYRDETSALCEWHIPETHYLEDWGDIRAYDGTVTVMQPLLAPLYASKSIYQVIECLRGESSAKTYDIVKNYWKQKQGGSDFEKAWLRLLHEGVVPASAYPVRKLTAVRDSAQKISAELAQSKTPATGTLEVAFRPDPHIWDGQYSNNGWLQELPKPFIKVTWDNVALMNTETVKKLGLKNGDVVELEANGRKVKVPVWGMPTHPVQSVTVYFGYGRQNAGRLAGELGYNAYRLRSSTGMWSSTVNLKKLGEYYKVVATHGHQSMEGRDLVRWGQLTDYLKNPEFLGEKEFDKPEFQTSFDTDPSKYPPAIRNEYQWGMSIDLTTCVGCNACVVACQSENNIPIVGKSEVAREREMHWLRIDTYYDEKNTNQVHFQPVPCMHCEQAPCEVVCPVGATNHSHEGLNQMVYNRCVGTKYCSNNCPYKVRRFNFFNYNVDPTPQIQMSKNPDVTVRGRGVMEKCTYCVQKINYAKIESEKEDRLIQDGEVRTACQSACPTGAITFGNLRDPASQVSKLKAEPLNYGLLAELNTKPRTTYLAKIRNSNPEVKSS